MIDINSLRERGSAEAFSVSELNNFIKNLLDGNRTLSAVTVRGEISNFKPHSSGHLYFSLKDHDGQIRAVMFRSSAFKLKFMPESGMRVIAHGSVSVFVRDGSYQLYVNDMQPDGIGALYYAYEQLKARLSAEGLFDAEHKLSIPRIPKSIGVITSPTGAAVRDIINVVKRRFPLADIYIYPTLVQGDGAAASLLRAVDYFDRSHLCDTVIIGRGGGSIEDLWAFNDEALARRIYVATVPIISAVGHETDFTICDFVADLRAPTPSAAAEQAVPDVRELAMSVDALSERAASLLRRRVELAKERLLRASDRVSAKAMLAKTDFCKRETEELKRRAETSVTKLLSDLRGRLSGEAGKLSALSPLAVLSRGYAVVSDRNGKSASIDELSVGDGVKIRISGGKLDASITKIEKNGE